MPAPMQGDYQSTVTRFRFGKFEVTSILDCKDIRDGLQASFGREVPAGQFLELCRASRIDPIRYEHPYIPTLINTGNELLLFDTGNGTSDDGRLAERLRQSGCQPENIDIVVLSHGHPDHIGGLMEAGKPVFPNARYIFGAAEFDFWRRGDNVREARRPTLELFRKIALPLAERSTFVKPGDEIIPGIHAIDAAGHSPGMIAWHIESEGKRLLIWADTCLHYVVSVQRPEWQAGVDDDKEKAVATRKRILDMAATDDLFVAGFHMPFPGIGLIERSSGSCRWVPVSYQFNV